MVQGIKVRTASVLERSLGHVRGEGRLTYQGRALAFAITPKCLISPAHTVRPIKTVCAKSRNLENKLVMDHG